MIEREIQKLLEVLVRADLSTQEGGMAAFRFISSILAPCSLLNEATDGSWSFYVDPDKLLLTIDSFLGSLPSHGNAEAMNYYFLAARLLEAWKEHAPVDDIPAFGNGSNVILAYYVAKAIIRVGSGGTSGGREISKWRKQILLWFLDPNDQRDIVDIARLLKRMDE